ncbi:hypothetical protein [Halomonas cupida]|uniref:hypothetical protein n=1 Tax=Halomonas cupida TaxID=44933 RepID=UPI003A8F9A0E
MATQGRVAVGHQADARPHPTSRSVHLRQCGADDNHIDQDELFDCHVINPACIHVGLMAAQGRAAVGHQADARPHRTSRSVHLRQCGADDNHIDQDELFDCHVINPACFHVGLMAAQGRAAVGHQADARPHHTSRSAYLRQCGADDNQIDQDELFDCHVNNSSMALGAEVEVAISGYHPAR